MNTNGWARTIVGTGMISCLCICTGASADEPTLAQLISQLQLRETKLKNLQVKCHSGSEQFNQESQKWEYNGETDLTAYLPGTPGGKGRCDVEKEIMPWTNAPVPFGLHVFSVAYNGENAQQLDRMSGDPGNPARMVKGTISQRRPAEMQNGFESAGWQYSIFGYSDPSGQTLSAYLKASQASPRVTVSLANVPRTNNFLMVTLSTEQVIKRIVIDTEQEYSIVSNELSLAGAIRKKFTVSKLDKLADGILYPSEVSEIYFEDGKPHFRVTYKASKLLANDPAFSDAIFSITWPGGTIVKDLVNNTQFVATGTPQGERVNRAWNAADQTAVTTAPTLAIGDAKPSEALQNSNPVTRVILLVVAIFVALLSIYFWRKRKSISI